jgi:hypothetical protein
MSIQEREIANVAMEILETINGFPDDESALGAVVLLREFLEGIEKQRRRIYWDELEWSEVQ